MNQLETLLNSLIKMGWKPWGKLVNTILYIHSKSMLVCLNSINEPKRQIKQDSLRELVSLESGLWQFCVEKGLVQKGLGFWRKGKKTIGTKAEIMQYQYKYRLLESALVPEEELEKFLLDSIKVEGTD